MSVVIGLNGHEHTFPKSEGWRVNEDGLLAVKEVRDGETLIIASFRNWDYAILNDTE